MGWRIAQFLIFAGTIALCLIDAKPHEIPGRLASGAVGGFLFAALATGIGTRIADAWPRHRWKAWHIGASLAVGLIPLIAIKPGPVSAGVLIAAWSLLFAMTAGLAFLLGFGVIAILNKLFPSWDNADFLPDDLAGGVKLGDDDARSPGQLRNVGGGSDTDGRAIAFSARRGFPGSGR